MPYYCKSDDCKGKKKQAFYNFIGLKPKFCSNCKKPDMIDVKNPKCISCNLIRPYFNYPNETKAICCVSCKKDGMIDIKNPKCECGKAQPFFNYPNETKAICCVSCKKPDMINVVSPKCECGKARPYFNYPNETKAICCVSCKKLDMINVVSPKCITESCEQFSQKDNYCWRCYYFYNPSKKPERLKVKEEEVVNYLKQEFKDIEMITDKALIGDGLCLKNRPDVLINLNKHSIIIEIDEEQHKYNNYKPLCEEARINNIQEALDRPIIIIRFNPDGYTENGKKVKSCFNIDKKTGMRVIPKNQEQNWVNRLAKLKDTLAFSLDNYKDDPIRIIKLFYDNV